MANKTTKSTEHQVDANTCLLDPALVERAIRAGKNVLITGFHGTGKTTTLLEVCQKIGYRIAIKGALMDPYVDFLGVPWVDGDHILKFARPEEFDEIDVLFFDDLNRARKEIRNQLFELIQFRSVNGHKLHNLKSVVCAVNPEKNGYQVEAMDPAQIDRFDVHINVKPAVSESWFITHGYSEQIARAIREWWDALGEDAKFYVTPRCVQRLVDLHLDEFPISYGIPYSVFESVANIPIADLERRLSESSAVDKLRKVLNTKDRERIATTLAQLNAQVSYFELVQQDQYTEYLDLLPDEAKAGLFSKFFAKNDVGSKLDGAAFLEQALGIQCLDLIHVAPKNQPSPSRFYDQWIAQQPENVAAAFSKAHQHCYSYNGVVHDVEAAACLLLPILKEIATTTKDFSTVIPFVGWIQNEVLKAIEIGPAHLICEMPLAISLACTVLGPDVMNGSANSFGIFKKQMQFLPGHKKSKLTVKDQIYKVLSTSIKAMNKALGSTSFDPISAN